MDNRITIDSEISPSEPPTGCLHFPVQMIMDFVSASTNPDNIETDNKDLEGENVVATQGVKVRYKLVAEGKKAGITYTPSDLSDFVADEIIKAAPINISPKTHILDPAVGDGNLLLSLLRRLSPDLLEDIVVHGFDTDKLATIKANERISAAFPELDVRLHHGSFLDFVLSKRGIVDGPSPFSRETPSHFDIVIANPPYVRTQILGAKRAQQIALAFNLNGRVDLYQPFLIGIAQVLKPTGIAGIIVSNRFMTTRGGSDVRKTLRVGLTIRHVWDFGDTKLFKAAVLPVVIIARGNSGQHSISTGFSTIYETSEPATSAAVNPIEAIRKSDVVALKDGRNFRVRHGTLDNSGALDAIWRLTNHAENTWLTTVQEYSWGTFRDIGKIRVGVKTCADKVFIRDNWFDQPPESYPELLRPLTTHHIARRFRANEPKRPRAILYPHETIAGQRRAVDLSQYPKSQVYLESHRATLEARTYLMEGRRLWYEIWVPQNPDAWDLPKLVFRDISEKPTFWLDLDGSIVNGDCYWILPDGADKLDLLWLAAAVANSTFAEEFYDHKFNNKLYAGRRRFNTQYVEQFPLPNPHAQISCEIVATAKMIYNMIGTSTARELEESLNYMIYEAFGLSFEKPSGKVDL